MAVVVTGSSYPLQAQRPEFRIEHSYCFDGRYFSVTLRCEEMQ